MKKGWNERQICDVCLVTDYVANGSFAALRENVQYLDEDGYAVLVRLADSTRGWNGNYKYVSEAAYRFLKKSSLIPGDLVMSNVGEPGKVFVVPDLGKPMTLGPNSVLIRCNAHDCESQFLFYYFSSNAGRAQIDEISEGVAQKKFNKTAFRALKLPVPPLAEQQRIVGLLDEAFEGVATAKANAEKNLQNARALFESHLQSVFTQRGPGWVEKPLGELCDILDNQRKPITKRDRVAGDIPYYGATCIQDYVKDFIFDEPLVLVGEDGAKWKSGDKTAFAVSGKCWVNNHAHVLRPHRDKTTDYWLISFLSHSDLTPFVSGLTVPKLNQGNLREIPIPLPPISIQRQLAETAESLEEETQRLARLYERKHAALEALKKSLLHQAFSGGL